MVDIAVVNRSYEPTYHWGGTTYEITRENMTWITRALGFFLTQKYAITTISLKISLGWPAWSSHFLGWFLPWLSCWIHRPFSWILTHHILREWMEIGYFYWILILDIYIYIYIGYIGNIICNWPGFFFNALIDWKTWKDVQHGTFYF